MSVSEADERQAVVDEAMSWIGTPYHHNADVKGAGVDCGMILVRVFVDTGERLERTIGHFPPPFDPRPYPNQWYLHNRAERYSAIVEEWARELPQGAVPQPGDITLFHYGHVYAHAGIVIDYPIVLHAMGPQKVQRQNVETNTFLRRLRKKHLTIWYN